MEEKKNDLSSLIGFALIGAILLYMMYQNQPPPDGSKMRGLGSLSTPRQAPIRTDDRTILSTQASR